MDHEMHLDRVLENLAVDIEPVAVCKVSRDWRLRLGGAETTTFHFVLRGEGRLLAGSGVAKPIRSRCLCLVPPRVPHALEGGSLVTHEAAAENVLERVGDLLQFVAGGEEGLTVVCGRADVSYGGGLRLFDMLGEPLVLDFSESAQMHGIFERMIEEERNPSVGSKAMTAALMNQCLVLTLRRLHADADCPLPWLTSLRDRRLARVLDAVVANPGDPHSVSSLAEHAFMSRSVFSQQFKLLFGISPKTFVNEVRLRKGLELLVDTELTVDAVARRVGYSSRSHFSHAFRNRFGRPPAGFRSASAAPSSPSARP